MDREQVLEDLKTLLRNDVVDSSLTVDQKIYAGYILHKINEFEEEYE